MTTRSLRAVTGGEPLLAWPGWPSLRFSLPLAYLFSKIFFSVYGGASLLASLRDPRPDFHFSWELDLPFFPSLSVVYLTVPLLLLLTPFILRTWRSFTPFFVTLTVETLIAGVFFLILPTTQAYPERIASGFFAGLFRLTDRMNLEYNEFPSLHLAFAVTAAVVFGRRCGWLGRALFTFWVTGVAASTLFLHEHHLLDLLGGVVLGLASVSTVWRQASREPVLEALQVDGLCGKELARFCHRLRRWPVITALVRTSLGRWTETRLLRATYCLAQHVADGLAGERKVKGTPEAQAEAALRVLRGLAPAGGSAADQLAAYVAASGDPVRKETIDLLEGLLADRRPRDAREIWTAAQAILATSAPA